MKVQKLNTKAVVPTFSHGVETVDTEDTDIVFRAKLDDMVHQDSTEFVQEKMRQISELGDKLCEKADIAQLNKYKGLIKELVDYTVSNGFKFSKSSSFDARGRGKVYGLIKKVNEKLDDLTREILEEESDNIQIVASINDIRGLLVDMMM